MGYNTSAIHTYYLRSVAVGIWNSLSAAPSHVCVSFFVFLFSARQNVRTYMPVVSLRRCCFSTETNPLTMMIEININTYILIYGYVLVYVSDSFQMSIVSTIRVAN